MNFEEILLTEVQLFFIATLRVAGSLQKSTEVMKAMQRLIKVPEVAATMRELSKEMMRVKLYFFTTTSINVTFFCTEQAGIIEEMLEDTLEGLEDTEELEEAAQEEVDKVLTFHILNNLTDRYN